MLDEVLLQRGDAPPSRLEELLGTPEWHADALCREYPQSWWFPERQTAQKLVPTAKAICDRCHVRRECLDYALSDPDAFENGLWAGTTPNERKLMRARRVA